MKYLTVANLAERTGISQRSLTYMIQHGTIPGGRKIGRRWVVSVEDFEGYMNRNLGVPPPPSDFRARMDAIISRRINQHG